MVNDNVLIQIVIVFGSIATTYLTVKYKNNIMGRDKKSNDEEPRTRMDTIFDGYEKLIEQQQEDIVRKEQQLERTQLLIDKLQRDIDETRAIVKKQHAELEEQKRLNSELVHQLEQLKKTRSSAESA